MPDFSITPYALHLAGAIGAAGLYLTIRPGPRSLRAAGAIVALAGAAMASVEVLRGLPALPGDVPVLPAFFGVVALVGAVRMITHPKPVYAAIYFVLVVIASAGLFLLLFAEFMAFALLIVYAGAILITYMFVLMLAQQANGEQGDDRGGALYDRVPREPLAAVAVGFLIFAALGHSLFSPRSDARRIPTETLVLEARERSWRELESMPRRLDAAVRAIDADAIVEAGPDGRAIRVAADGSATVRVRYDDRRGTSVAELPLPDSALPTNTQSVGLALVASFPASLELASVILLMAMFGAVVLARKQIEIGEDDRREAAGLRRLAVDEDLPPRGGRA